MSDETTCNRNLGALPRLNVASLTPAEQFVLRVCRCWDAFMDDPDPNLPWRELTPVFSYMNVAGALCAFECIFTPLHRQRLRTLRFQDVDAASVGTDEARMLCSLACLQREQGQASIGVLLGALTPQGVRTLLPPLARAAAILDRQGHRLPAWRFASARNVRLQRQSVQRHETSWPPRCPVQ